MDKITIKFPRPLVITFGILVFVSGVLVTAAIGWTIRAVLMAVWPDAWR